MQRHLILALFATLLFGCERAKLTEGSTTHVPEAAKQPAIWDELDLSLADMTKFCADEAENIAPLHWEESATPEVDEVPEPEGAPMVKPPAINVAAGEVVVTVGEQVKSFPRAGDGFDWGAIRAALVEIFPKQETRPKIEVLVAADVPWEHLFRVVEAAAYRDDGQRLFDVVF